MNTHYSMIFLTIFKTSNHLANIVGPTQPDAVATLSISSVSSLSNSSINSHCLRVKVLKGQKERENITTGCVGNL